jgi:hypothetical protein
MIALHQDISDLRSQLSIYESAGVVTKQWRPDEKDFSPELAHEFERRRRRLEDALDVWRDEYYDPQDCSPLAVSSKALYHLGHILIRFNLRDLPGAASGE